MRELKDLLEPLTDREMPDRWDAIGRRRVEPLPEPARSRVSAYLMSGVVALLAIAVIAWLAPLGDHAPIAGSTSPEDQPPAWLVEGAYRFAYGNGDLAPDSAEWVLADADAVAPAVGLQSGDPRVDRYLVVLHGDFTAYGASPPRPASLPTGHVAVAAFDANSHDITDWGIGDQEVDVQGLMPFSLPGPADTFESEQGWSTALPPGWSTTGFAVSWSGDSSEGTVISNTQVETPADTNGPYFPQVSGDGFPSGGVALVIATMQGVIPGDTQPVQPPLSLDEFAKGSAGGRGGSTLDSLVFQGPSGNFVATVRTGPDASPQDLDAVEAVVRSLTFTMQGNPPSTDAVLPTPETVIDGRFVVPVELDDGFLRLDPVPAGDQPPLTTDIQDLLMASSALSGKNASVLGYGLITLEGAQHGQDAVHAVPGWIVFGWGGIYNCPAMTAAPSPVDLPSDGYVAVAILPGDEMSDFSYEARSSGCGAVRGPSIGMAMHVESIAWEQAGPIQQDQVKISYTLPPCGNDATYVIGGDAAGSTLTVNVSVPDAPLPCPSPAAVTKTVPLLGGDPGTLQHAPVGLVPQL